jgi:hypothetical protein
LAGQLDKNSWLLHTGYAVISNVSLIEHQNCSTEMNQVERLVSIIMVGKAIFPKTGLAPFALFI